MNMMNNLLMLLSKPWMSPRNIWNTWHVRDSCSKGRVANLRESFLKYSVKVIGFDVVHEFVESVFVLKLYIIHWLFTVF